MQALKYLIRLTGKLFLALIVGSFMLVLALRWINPPGSMVMLVWQLKHENEIAQQWRPLSQISPHLQVSVIASEDQKFAEHFGFDLKSIRQALDVRGEIFVQHTLTRQEFVEPLDVTDRPSGAAKSHAIES